MSVSLNLNLKIDEKCKITHDNLIAFVRLLSEVIPLSLDDFDFFNTIWIVPDNDIEEKVNMVIKDVPGNKKYTTGLIVPKGITVPIENESTFYCLIFLRESLLKDIDVEHYHQSEVVLTLIEELLHVKLYTIIKKQRGYVQKIKETCACKADLFVVCSQILDEFIVNRWKAIIIKSNPLIEHNGILTCGEIRYNEKLQPILDSSFENLYKIVHGAGTKTISIHDAWIKLLNCIYREIFEPLSRNAAFLIKCISNFSIDDDVENSWFYAEHIKPFWHRIYAELQKATTNTKDIDPYLNQIMKIIEEFLEYIGVTFKELDDNKSWVYFNSERLIKIYYQNIIKRVKT